MINKHQMNFFKKVDESDLKIDIQPPKHIIFDRIYEIELQFKHYKNVVINEIQKFNVNLNGEITIISIFSPALYNRLGHGSIVNKMIIRGFAVDLSESTELLEFETSFDFIKNTNVITGFNTDDSNNMVIVFSDAHED